MKNRLKVERAICDLTQQPLAEQVGVSRQTINAIEKGNYVPSTTLSLKLARVFSKPLEEIFQLDEND